MSGLWMGRNYSVSNTIFERIPHKYTENFVTNNFLKACVKKVFIQVYHLFYFKMYIFFMPIKYSKVKEKVCIVA